MLYEKSEDWLRQSSLLLEARPETTKITTRYTKSPARRQPSKTAAAAAAQAPGKASAQPPRATLELKTYDPVSGVALKYHTTKAAEVGRLIQMLGGPLGRRMAGVPVQEDGGAGAAGADEEMPDAPTPVAEAAPVSQQAPAAGGGGTVKGKKKKGKR